MGCTSTAPRKTLGISREQMIEQLLAGTAKYSSIFITNPNWADVGAGRLARRWRGHHEPNSDLSLLLRSVRAAMVRICKEESFHQRPGLRDHVVSGAWQPEQRQMAQDGLNRWCGRRS